MHMLNSCCTFTTICASLLLVRLQDRCIHGSSCVLSGYEDQERWSRIKWKFGNILFFPVAPPLWSVLSSAPWLYLRCKKWIQERRKKCPNFDLRNRGADKPLEVVQAPPKPSSIFELFLLWHHKYASKIWRHFMAQIPIHSFHDLSH